MSERKFRGERVVLDDGREVVIPKLPIGLQRDNIEKIKVADASAVLDGADAIDNVIAMNLRMAEVVHIALALNHPEITLEDLVATCSGETISELYLAMWKRRGGQAKGEAGSP